jgi:rod shape-determining protein MreC
LGKEDSQLGKSLFIHGPPASVRLLLFVILSVVLMTLDHRGQQLEFVRNTLALLLYPVQYAVNVPVVAVRWAGENLASRNALLEENTRMRQKQLVLESRLGKLNELEAENRRLRDLLGSSDKVSDRVLIAELLAVDMDPFSRRIVLNQGSRDGVFVGQSLVDADGILGQVTHVGPFSSIAMLITDPSHAFPIQVTRSGLRAIAVGTGSVNLLELSHIPNNADLQVGDALVTSGLGRRFPPGYPVGKIKSIERDKGQPFAKVLVEPSAKLERNREVLLVWPTTDRKGEDVLPPSFPSPDTAQGIGKADG